MSVFLGWLWPRGMRYVERTAVAACGPVLAFVVVCGRVKCIVLFLVASVVCVLCAYACLTFVVDKPSLRALRAETMVERFTARMHVFRPCRGRSLRARVPSVAERGL